MHSHILRVPLAKLRLFPHVLTRVAGGPFEDFAELGLRESVRATEAIHDHRERLKGIKLSLCDALFHIIELCAVPADRVGLINVKRDIFNERNISTAGANLLASYAPPSVSAELKEYLDLKDSLPALLQEGKAIFDNEMLLAREQLMQLAKNPILQKGLLLSSQSLLKSINNFYLNRESVSSSRKDRDTEEGLIKYLSRVYAKTSPFSTFTHLAMGRIVDQPETDLSGINVLIDLKGDPQSRVTSHIRLNNSLYQYLRRLLIKHPDTYRWLLVRPNPTIQKIGNQYAFLTNSNNIEAFQRLPANPAIELFVVMTKSKREGILYKDLVQTVVEEEFIDASSDEIESYVSRLIELGFLEFNFEVSGINPDWDIELRDRLRRIEDHVPLVSELTKMLRSLRELAKQFGETGVEARQELLDDAFNEFKTYCMRLHQAADLPAEERLPREEYIALQKRRRLESSKNKNEIDDTQTGEVQKEEEFRHQNPTLFTFKPEQMFYEDTTLDIVPILNQNQLAILISPLHELLKCLKLFEGHIDERDKMRSYFVSKYGEEAEIQLLTFYEDYYREIKRPEAEKVTKMRKEQLERQNKTGAVSPNETTDARQNGDHDGGARARNQPEFTTIQSPKMRERAEQRAKWMQGLNARLKDRVADSKDALVNVALEDLEEIAALVKNVEPKEENCSHGIFIQLFEDGQGNGGSAIKGVINRSFPGFGKMMSRFLHIFDEVATRDLRAWNQQLSNEHLLLEDCDASFFNANLHPPLMPFEVWMPSGHNSVAPENQIPVTELHVSVSSDKESLRLIHDQTGKVVRVFDLGFQGQGGRSQLFQLLELFTMAKYLHYQQLKDIINGLAQSESRAPDQPEQNPAPHIRIEPRVVFQETLILQRKAWIIPKELLPDEEANESEWVYFQKVNEWRRSLEMPYEVFIFLMGRMGNQDLKPEEARRLGRDDYKPQYIDFRNPFLTNLFRKVVKKATRTLRIEEMLPNSEQLAIIGGKKRVTEFLIQWYANER